MGSWILNVKFAYKIKPVWCTELLPFRTISLKSCFLKRLPLLRTRILYSHYVKIRTSNNTKQEIYETYFSTCINHINVNCATPTFNIRLFFTFTRSQNSISYYKSVWKSGMSGFFDEVRVYNLTRMMYRIATFTTISLKKLQCPLPLLYTHVLYNHHVKIRDSNNTKIRIISNLMYFNRSSLASLYAFKCCDVVLRRSELSKIPRRKIYLNKTL